MTDELKAYSGSPRITTEYRDCSMPFSFDQHKGCGFKCLYCFAYFQRYANSMSKDDYQKNLVRVVDVKRILNLLDGKATNRIDKFFYKNFISKRKIIQWGALGDPFCWIEKEKGTGLPILQKLAEMKYPVSLSTKGTWFVDDERYMNCFKKSPETFHVKFSIITSDEKKAKEIEQAVATPKERFRAMKKLSDIGVATTLRLRPFLIGLTDLNLEETIKSAKEAGAISVSTEFFCLETRMAFKLKQRYKDLNKILGYDLVKFYQRHSIRTTSYLRLSREIKAPYVKQLQDLCLKYGLKLYVSDPDFKEISCHGACCGLPQTKEFDNYNKGQWTELIVYMRENKKKTITWTEFLELNKEDFEWQKELHVSEYVNCGSARGHYLQKNKTMYNHTHNLWNDPNNPNSPYKYFRGTFVPKGTDEKGDMTYELVR